MPIRARLTLLFAAGTLAVLAVAGTLFVLQLRAGLQSSLDTALRARAAVLVAQVEGNDGTDLPDSGPGTLIANGDAVAQVITPSGQVLAGSDGLSALPLLTAARQRSVASGPVSFDATVTVNTVASRLRLLAVAAGTHAVVVVGTDRSVVDGAVSRSSAQLVVLCVVAVLLGSAGAWLLTRAALRPVERMGVQADELGADDAAGSLTVPNTRDEISRLAVTMNALLGRLHDALARERAFVADAGHELRTPLTILKGELELARRPGRSPTAIRQTLDVASAETDRLIRLSEDLLVLASSGRDTPLRAVAVDVRPLLAATAAAHDVLAVATGVRVVLDAGPAAADLVATLDTDRMRQALDNLLANARRFAPDGTHIVLRARLTGPVLEVVVEDEGPGFPPDLLVDAFLRFRRGDGSRHRDGSGLGLAIVSGIAAAHGGSVSAANRVGAGARVTLCLPVAPQPRARARPPLVCAPAPTAPPRTT